MLEKGHLNRMVLESIEKETLHRQCNQEVMQIKLPWFRMSDSRNVRFFLEMSDFWSLVSSTEITKLADKTGNTSLMRT